MNHFLTGPLLFLAGALSGSVALQLLSPNRTNCAPTTPTRSSKVAPTTIPAAAVSPRTEPLATPPMAPLREMNLLIPVLGITPKQLVDTFDDTRGEGRGHEAIDIMAPLDTAVLAVEDGTVAKLFDSKQGGHTIYQFDQNREITYYYAHLNRYAAGLVEGQAVRRGDLIGYVGFSGNASPQAPHLHFAIFLLGPEKRWWQGTAINPYPYLGGQ